MPSDESSAGTPRIVLVQCTNSKRRGSHPARDLYDESDYFRKQREYAAHKGDKWFVQSAKYGLLRPDDVVSDYDRHASDLTDAEEWAEQIADAIENDAKPPAIVEILGGKDYADPLTPELERHGYDVVEPLRGQGIGTRKHSLAEMAAEVSHANLSR